MPSKEKEKNVTLIDLAKILKLTPRAVSKALNGEDSTVRVSDATRKRVQALAQRLNYRPNRMAQTLRTGKSGMVGILVCQAFGHIFQLKLYYARQYAEKCGFIPNIYVVPDDSVASRSRAVDVMIDSKVDAVIIFNDFGDKQVERLIAASVPVVMMGITSAPRMASYFGDIKGGFSALATHLIGEGARSLSLLGINETPDPQLPWHVQSARDGIEDAIQKARLSGLHLTFHTHIQELSFEGFMLRDVPHIHGLHAGGYLAMREFLRKQPAPDAVICIGDAVAQGALLVCSEMGIRVPQQMLIAGCGDEPSSSAGLLPLTTIRPPLDELCRLAFEHLMKMLDGQASQEFLSVCLPYKLIPRASSRKPV